MSTEQDETIKKDDEAVAQKRKPKVDIDKGLLSVLFAAGIDAEGLTKEQALEKINEIVNQNKKLREDLVEAAQSRADEEKSILAKKMTSYMQTHDSLLTDKEFVARLFDMGVPPVFLKLFRDYDSTLTKSKIWERIRLSSIKTYNHDLGELLSKRKPYGRTGEHDPYKAG